MPDDAQSQPAKNPAAVALGKLSAASLSAEERKARASAGGRARWKKHKSQRARGAVMRAVAASITPEAARARAKKAWETKRRKAAAKRNPKPSND